MDESLVPYWRGTLPVKSRIETDYERACATKDYLEKLSLNGGVALVLGDMPLETTVWSGRIGAMIVRLYYADPGTNFGELLTGINNDVFRDPLETTSYEVASGHIAIFEASADGQDPNRSEIRFGLEAGSYKILTTTLQPDDRTSLLLHRFVPLN